MWQRVTRRWGQTDPVARNVFPAIGFTQRPHFRRALVLGLIAFVALVVGDGIGGVSAGSLRSRLIVYGCALLVAIFGVVASRTAAHEIHRVAVARAGQVAATPLRLMTLLIGYLITALSVLGLVGVELRQLLVGGAITGVILGLAAQPVLGNLFAGLVLLFARPYLPGEQVRVLSGSISGPLVGAVVSAGLLYTVLETAEGLLNIPNSALLQAAVGPSLKEAAEQGDGNLTAPDSAAAGRDTAAFITVTATGDDTYADGNKRPER